MLSITPPQNITHNKLSGNKYEVIIEPCYPGYGVTIGNSLRRALLASLDGAAIVGFKINGVNHEFSAIDNVKEDVVEIILNLKKRALAKISVLKKKLVDSILIFLKISLRKSLNAQSISLTFKSKSKSAKIL